MSASLVSFSSRSQLGGRTNEDCTIFLILLIIFSLTLIMLSIIDNGDYYSSPLEFGDPRFNETLGGAFRKCDARKTEEVDPFNHQLDNILCFIRSNVWFEKSYPKIVVLQDIDVPNIALDHVELRNFFKIYRAAKCRYEVSQNNVTTFYLHLRATNLKMICLWRAAFQIIFHFNLNGEVRFELPEVSVYMEIQYSPKTFVQGSDLTLKDKGVNFDNTKIRYGDHSIVFGNSAITVNDTVISFNSSQVSWKSYTVPFNNDTAKIFKEQLISSPRSFLNEPVLKIFKVLYMKDIICTYLDGASPFNGLIRSRATSAANGYKEDLSRLIEVEALKAMNLWVFAEDTATSSSDPNELRTVLGDEIYEQFSQF